MNGHVLESEFEQLLWRNRGRMVAIARTYAGLDFDDLLQEIQLQIWRSLGGFQERSSIDTWCYRVALNTAISWRRSAERRKDRLPRDEQNVDVLTSSDDGSDSCELLRKFLETLADSDRALVLMYMEDMSGAEMADVLGVSAGALRVRIHRIKQRLASWEVGDP